MKITSKDIINKIDNEFSNVYRPFSTFQNSGSLWDSCINTVRNADLLQKIIFCNDVLQAPPAQVFLKATSFSQATFTNYEKKAIGAFWGFIFKFTFNYTDQKETTINTKGVKKATYFLNPVSHIEIIK